MKEAIVTGAGGFVGKQLIRKLNEHGVHVTALDLAGTSAYSLIHATDLVTPIPCTVDDAPRLAEIIAQRSFDVFYNLAWAGAAGPNRADYHIQLKNVETCLDYLASADQLGCRKFISVGTVGQFMAEHSIQRDIVSENFVYAIAKSFCERLLMIQRSRVGCEVVWATFTNLYGPGDTTPNLVNYTIKTLLAGESPNYGPAQQPYDFIHVNDCTEALYLLGDCSLRNNSYLIGSGQWRPLKDFLLEIGSIVAPEIKLGIGVRPDDKTIYLPEWFNTSPLCADTGFSPAYSFADGIRETTAWLQQRMNEEQR